LSPGRSIRAVPQGRPLVTGAITRAGIGTATGTEWHGVRPASHPCWNNLSQHRLSVLRLNRSTAAILAISLVSIAGMIQSPRSQRDYESPTVNNQSIAEEYGTHVLTSN
jgi:hypothetical protein